MTEVEQLKAQLRALEQRQAWQENELKKFWLDGIHRGAMYFETAQSLIDFNAGYTKRMRTPQEVENYADAMTKGLEPDFEKAKERLLPAPPALKTEETT